jgi:GntR family transcriptional regulator
MYIQYERFYLCPSEKREAVRTNVIISNASEAPIYRQIADQIRGAVLRGELPEGTLLPSIRALARDLRISVITTKRAYDELEQEGFIASVAGKGSFVAERSPGLLHESRLGLVEEKLEEAVKTARSLGVARGEMLRMLDLLYEEEKG